MIVKRNENTAELVGLSFGDGGLTYRKNTNRMRFQLCGSLKDDKDHYDKYIIPLFNLSLDITPSLDIPVLALELILLSLLLFDDDDFLAQKSGLIFITLWQNLYSSAPISSALPNVPITFSML